MNMFNFYSVLFFKWKLALFAWQRTFSGDCSLVASVLLWHLNSLSATHLFQDPGIVRAGPQSHCHERHYPMFCSHVRKGVLGLFYSKFREHWCAADWLKQVWGSSELIFQEPRTMTQKTGRVGTEDRWSSRGVRTGRASKEVKMAITAGSFSHRTLWIQDVLWSSQRRLWKRPMRLFRWD